MITPEAYLKGNSYPGRGILIGRSEDGKKSVVVYFIMGRSENSRNRIFVADGDGFRTQAFDESKLIDPSLIIYWPLRMSGSDIIITNGDQTDTIRDALALGGTFESALRTRTFEPDGPNFTPRISGIVHGEKYALSILKTEDGDEESPRRFFYEYENEKPGRGHIIHTYMGDGSPLPSFSGEPAAIEINGSCEEYANRVWSSLNEDNRVSLLCLFTDTETGKRESVVINKHS